MTAGQATSVSQASAGIVLADESEVMVNAIFTETASFNTLRITAPIDQTLASGNPIIGAWRFGSFPAGSPVRLDLLSGVGGGVSSKQIIHGSGSCWLIEFEDGTDNDFNDEVVVVTAVAPGSAHPYTGPEASARVEPQQLAAATRDDGTRVTTQAARFVVDFNAVTACTEQPVDGWVDIYEARDPQHIGTWLAYFDARGRGEAAWDAPAGTPLTTADQLCFFATYQGGSGFSLFFTYLRACAQVPQVVSIKVDTAYGHNPGTPYLPSGSFTSAPGENLVTVEATAIPGTLAPGVQWSVVRTSGAAAETQPVPIPPLPGATSSFNVPPPSNPGGRWGVYSYSASLEVKRLGYEVTATVSSGGTQYQSEPPATRVYQDEIDVIRQEYVDLQVAQGDPARAHFTIQPPVAHRSGSGLNTGDYGFMVFNNDFVAHMNQLSAAWTTYGQWQINSQYRNPAHQRFHIPQSSRPGRNSWHQYGCAADIQTFGADSIAQDDFWRKLADLADTLGFDYVEPKNLSKVGHVHVEFHFCQ